MKEYKLHNTDGKTFFDFRSNPKSRGEGFTLSYLDDGTVVMSGDYGTLCWRRNWHNPKEKEFHKDYGFPNKETSLIYFDEKVCQFGIKQETEKFDLDKAVEMFKERYSQEERTNYNDILNQLESLEEYDEIKFHHLVSEVDQDAWEYEWKSYTSQFCFMFDILQSVSDQILEAVKKAKEEKKK